MRMPTRLLFLVLWTIANCATGAEAELYSRDFLRTLIVWGYKVQSSRLLGTEGSPSTRESIDKAWSAVLATPEAKFAETPRLASLFASDVADKTAAVAAWHALRLADCPSYAVVLDRRKVLGFTEEWSVIIGEGDVKKEVIDGDSITTCDKLILGGYSNATMMNSLPLQYSGLEDAFVCTRAYLRDIQRYGQVFAEFGRIEVPVVDVDGIDFTKSDPWKSLCRALLQESWKDNGGKLAWQIGFASDRNKLRARASGVQVKGLQMLARGCGRSTAAAVSGFSEIFESIFLNVQTSNIRVGLGSMIDMAVSSESDLWKEYFKEVISIARKRASAANEPFQPLVYLFSRNDQDLREILKSAMISQFESLLQALRAQIFEDAEGLGEQQFTDCAHSFAEVLSGRALPYLFSAQYYARKQEWKKSSEALARGFDRVSGRELGRLKFAQFRLAGQSPELKAYSDDEAIARLTEIVGLDGVSMGPSVRLARLHMQLGHSAQALEVLRKLREQVAAEDQPQVDKVINEVKAVP